VACLCGTDADYELHAEPACAALRAAGAASIVMARRPADGDEALRAAGLSGHVFKGCDAAKILGELRSTAATPSQPETR
jgi:methylmalonyl-CoA mutase